MYAGKICGITALRCSIFTPCLTPRSPPKSKMSVHEETFNWEKSHDYVWWWWWCFCGLCVWCAQFGTTHVELSTAQKLIVVSKTNEKFSYYCHHPATFCSPHSRKIVKINFYFHSVDKRLICVDSKKKSIIFDVFDEKRQRREQQTAAKRKHEKYKNFVISLNISEHKE